MSKSSDLRVISYSIPANSTEWSEKEREMRFALLAAGLAVVCPAVLGMTIDDLRPGKTVNGPDLKVGEMHGKVVYVEFWGTR